MRAALLASARRCSSPPRPAAAQTPPVRRGARPRGRRPRRAVRLRGDADAGRRVVRRLPPARLPRPDRGLGAGRAEPRDVGADGRRPDPGREPPLLALRAGAAGGRQVHGHDRRRPRPRRRPRCSPRTSVPVRVGAPAAATPPAAGPRAGGGGLFPRGLFPRHAATTRRPRGRSRPRPGVAFIRAVADKPRAFVGEQVTVTWYLYLTEPQNNFQPHHAAAHRRLLVGGAAVDEPAGAARLHRSGRGGAPLSGGGAARQGAVPARPRQADRDADGGGGRAGRLLRAARARAPPQVRPGHRSRRCPCRARGSRRGSRPATSAGTRSRPPSIATAVAVGDAVTLTVTVQGGGKRAQRRAAGAAARSTGWKSYEPKTNVAVDAGRGRSRGARRSSG